MHSANSQHQHVIACGAQVMEFTSHSLLIKVPQTYGLHRVWHTSGRNCYLAFTLRSNAAFLPRVLFVFWYSPDCIKLFPRGNDNRTAYCTQLLVTVLLFVCKRRYS